MPDQPHITVDSLRLTPAATLPEWEAPMPQSELAHITVGRVPYTLGQPPRERTSLPGYDSGVLCLLLGAFVLLAVNLRHYSTYLKNFAYDLWSIRRSDSTFAQRTINETGIQASVVFIVCLCEGIILDSLAPPAPLARTPFLSMALLTAGALLFYLWQLAAYRTVGYVFIDRISARQWLKGFNASQALLGALILIPALVVLFNPGSAPLVGAIAATAYLVARMIFICKGFRLFYENFGSLIYFILYLCTLEIVPLLLIFRGIRLFSNFST